MLRSLVVGVKFVPVFHPKNPPGSLSFKGTLAVLKFFSILDETFSGPIVR